MATHCSGGQTRQLRRSILEAGDLTEEAVDDRLRGTTRTARAGRGVAGSGDVSESSCAWRTIREHVVTRELADYEAARRRGCGAAVPALHRQWATDATNT
jgi:hypothetical protein